MTRETSGNNKDKTSCEEQQSRRSSSFPHSRHWNSRCQPHHQHPPSPHNNSCSSSYCFGEASSPSELRESLLTDSSIIRVSLINCFDTDEGDVLDSTDTVDITDCVVMVIKEIMEELD